MKATIMTLLIIVMLTVLPPDIVYAASIRLDGDFTDWLDKPFYDSEDNNEVESDGFKQLKWHLSQEEDKLYIMVAIKKPKRNGKGKITTVLETDFGKFQAVTDYEVEDIRSVSSEVYEGDFYGESVSSSVYGMANLYSSSVRSVNVLTTVNNKNQNWREGGNWGSIMPDGSIYIEYGIPVKQMIEGMDWGYLIKFRLLNASGDAPKNSWITVSSAGTFPIVGVGISIAAGIIVPTFIMRKKKE